MRPTLTSLIERIRAGHLNNSEDVEALADFEQLLPGTDVNNLCWSDYDTDTIVDICLGTQSAMQILSKQELTLLVRKLRSNDPTTFRTEADATLAVMAFTANCVHPAGTDLVHYPEQYFDGRIPSDEEIVELATRLKNNT